MRFAVPQFIEHEAKIIGPLTFKQSAYIGSAAVISFILYHIIPWAIFLPIAIILALSSCALAFLKINGIPLPTILTNGFNFFISSRIYLWQKKKFKSQKQMNIQVFEKTVNVKPLEVSEISHLKKTKTKIETK